MTDAPSPQPAAPARVRRWIGPALLVSLIVNAFLLGLIAAATLTHRPWHHAEFRAPPLPFLGMMRRGTADLPPNERAFMRDIMVQQFPIIRPYYVKIDQARKELADVIAATPYDPAKVGEAFAKVDVAQSEMVKATREGLIEGFGKMSTEQRARLAATMRKQAERHLMGGQPNRPALP